MVQMDGRTDGLQNCLIPPTRAVIAPQLWGSVGAGVFDEGRSPEKFGSHAYKCAVFDIQPTYSH